MKKLKILFASVLAIAVASCTKTTFDSGSSASVSPSCTPTTTLTGTQTASVTVPAGGCYGFTGLVIFSSGTTLTIGAGARMVGTAGNTPASSIIIQPGAKIDAQGSAIAPIVFTSSANVGSRAPQDWGGIIIRGNASHNTGGTGATAYTTEFDDNFVWGAGASTDNDNSGTLKYVRVEFGSKQATSLKEYNGFTFEMVGNGTTVDYIHAHRVGDDGVEFFGGTVNVKHVISSAFGDDGFDWTFGWRGKAQYVVVNMTNGDSGADSNGIEGDNSEFGDTYTPYSNPTLYNFTLVSNGGEWRQIMRLRRGTKALMKNFYVGNWCDTILVESATSIGFAGTELLMTNSLFEGIKRGTTNGTGGTCAGTATTALDSTGILNGAGYNGFIGTGVTANATVSNGLSTTNWVSAPPSGAWKPSAAITTNAATPPNDGFFDTSAAFIGAVGGTDWTAWAVFPDN